ncbi:hypothetical protein [Nitrospirillum amazonense]|nr:hypothetical protein [Nitrospirillum amazonense]
MKKLGIMDPTLNMDTPLFIDPILLDKSAHPEMREASRTYSSHFEKLMELLEATKRPNDPAWKAAERLISYNEIKGTCLGFGADSISGHGFGKGLSSRLISTAKEIVDIGIKNPRLFPSMMLFEDNVGADRISDLTTNVIIKDILKFNDRVVSELNLRTTHFSFPQHNIHSCNLIKNPTQSNDTPIILVPTDILREIPAAGDWDEIMAAAQRNMEIRDEFNKHLGEIWKEKIRKDKAIVRGKIFSSPDSIRVFSDAINNIRSEPYDQDSDLKGIIYWHSVIGNIADKNPLKIEKPHNIDIGSVSIIVSAIIDQFRNLIENKGLWKELWADGHPRPEKSVQRLFLAVADSYCKANDLDITPEGDSGTGPVDFKFSNGYSKRVLVEIKLSTNRKLIQGYSNQLEAYKKAEETIHGFYLVIDVGGLGKKGQTLLDMKSKWTTDRGHASEVEFIDGNTQLSASKQ